MLDGMSLLVVLLLLGRVYFCRQGARMEHSLLTIYSDDKWVLLSQVDVFHLQRGSWEQQTTSGTPPLGVRGYACVAVDSELMWLVWS